MTDRLTWPPHVLVAALLLLTGALLRLLYLGELPAGLNQDEASIGYEAWALLHHGITRNGYAWPVNFVAWGSGQSVLYAYLSLPIIAALDLTVFSTRLVMALTGAASLLLFWRVAARAQLADTGLDDAGDEAVSGLVTVRDQPDDAGLDDTGDGTVSGLVTARDQPDDTGPDDTGDEAVSGLITVRDQPDDTGLDDTGDGAVSGRTAVRDQPAFALLALLLLTFCSWHLMLSRWALDANLLPFVILFSVYFFTRPDHHRLGVQAAGVLVLSLSVYAYTAAYLFAPVFLASVFGWLRVQGKLPLRHFLLLSALSLLTVLPILLFLAVKFFDWEAIRMGISVPKYTEKARYEVLSTVFGGRFLEYLADQPLFVVKLLTTSDPFPTEPFSKMPGFAVLFPFAIVPLAVGFGATLYRAVTRRDFGVHLLMALWLIAAFATVSIAIVNIYRANVVWLPAVYFTALGVFYTCRRWRALLLVAAAAYLIYGGWFVHTYFTQFNSHLSVSNYNTFQDLESAISSVAERAGPNDKIYITRNVHEAYMQTLFHTKTPPRDYLNTRNIHWVDHPDGPFTNITSFGRFIFTPERAGEADYLVLTFRLGRGMILHPDENEQVRALDATGRCDAQYHGNFVVLHCG